jgi:hypothetical protein
MLEHAEIIATYRSVAATDSSYFCRLVGLDFDESSDFALVASCLTVSVFKASSRNVLPAACTAALRAASFTFVCSCLQHHDKVRPGITNESNYVLLFDSLLFDKRIRQEIDRCIKFRGHFCRTRAPTCADDWLWIQRVVRLQPIVNNLLDQSPQCLFAWDPYTTVFSNRITDGYPTLPNLAVLGAVWVVTGGCDANHKTLSNIQSTNNITYRE